MSDLEQDPRHYVPHRPPILCIDSVLSVDDRRATVSHTVAEDEIFRDGLWETFLIEGLAQTAAVLSGNSERGSGLTRRKGMLVGIRDLSIHRRPRVGEVVHYHAELIKKFGALTLVHGRAMVGDEEVATGSMKFYVEVA